MVLNIVVKSDTDSIRTNSLSDEIVGCDIGRVALAVFPFSPTVIVGGSTSSFTLTLGAKVDICDGVVDR